ncbi:hypothetical protein LTR64_007117 [Lithohypha guttulata]|uniref:uncharacterized protein n=1 Tax=Lithohypha guttulata TaxID=1690604 RepID=UPI00315D1752
MPQSTAAEGNVRPKPPRRFSSHMRQHRGSPAATSYGTFGTIGHNLTSTGRTNAEIDTLLEQIHEEDEHADSDGLYPPNCSWTADGRRPVGTDLFNHDEWPVYKNIHGVRHEIINSIDDPYSLEQLKAPRMNISVVRPLVDQFYESQDLSIVYCLLVNRFQFFREQSFAAHHQTVNLTRALLCEIVAEKVLRRYNERNPGPKGLLKLANILVAAFEPFQNAPDDVVKNNYHVMHYMRKKGGKMEKGMTALEVAIISESKSFLASSACQKVVDAIYRGKIVYTPNSFLDILPDYWKKRPVSLYDPRRGPLLNQYRLAVPRTRSVIEISQYFILLVLYLLVMESRESRQTTTYRPLEMVFDVYTWGWVLDQVASMLEHGWSVYTQNLWSFLDVMFCAIFVFYFWVRMYALGHDDLEQAQDWARLALDALSCAAPILIPRLAFNLLSDNLVFLCLRDMLANFVTLVFMASWCFVGFLLSLKWIHNGLHEPVTIGKWMIWIWFGLDGTGIQKSPSFHWFLGPMIMILFAFLGNTLFVTILVSMLSNTFSKISANAVQEMQYRRAVLTFEGVKADALFSYMPPLNLFALLFILPLKFVLTPRWFHKVNVFCVKIFNAPLLILISLYERRVLWVSSKYKRMRARDIDWNSPDGPHTKLGWLSRNIKYYSLSRFSAHGDLEAVFDEVPAQTAQDAEHEEGIGRSLREGFVKQFDQKKRSENLKRSLMSTISSSLKKEFNTDSDDGDDEDEAPKGYSKVKRNARKDSLMDFNENNTSMTEANARLHSLEESMVRIEALLLQLTNGEASDEPIGEDDAPEVDDAPPGAAD